MSSCVPLSEGKKVPEESYRKNEIGSWFFKNSITPSHPHLETRIHLTPPLIGIGAPAYIMLNKVAEILHTELILPDYYFVANAVGAVAGSVMVNEDLLVYPRLSESGMDIISYYVQARDSREEFEGLDDAMDYAKQEGKKKALNAALLSGAENPQVVIEEDTDGMDSYRLRIKAIGNPRLGK